MTIYQEPGLCFSCASVPPQPGMDICAECEAADAPYLPLRPPSRVDTDPYWSDEQMDARLEERRARRGESLSAWTVGGLFRRQAC